MVCKARQFSDQMRCHTCGLVWDVNDPEPPRCSPLPVTKTPAVTRDKGEGRRIRQEHWDYLKEVLGGGTNGERTKSNR